MGDLMDKLEVAKRRIADGLMRAARPCVLWSGGKDSTVVLYLAREFMPGIECVFFTLPWQRRKLEFARRLESSWGLTMYDAAPREAGLCRGNGRIDVMEVFGLKGEGQTLTVARGTEPMEKGREFVCGLDWVSRPKAETEFPWDVALHGHRSMDVDPLSGPVPLQADALPFPGGTETVFPLRDWTDAEVWRFTQERGIPWDAGRYDADGKALPDKGLNSDYFHACFACCDGEQGDFVSCPKRGGAMIGSLAGRVRWVEPQAAYCSLRTEAKGDV